MAPVKVQVAGYRLRTIRESLKLTLMDVQIKTKELARQGRGKLVYGQQVQRIEAGNISKPPILDLLSIGQALGMGTKQVLELYGLWVEGTGQAEVHPTLQEAQRVLDQLDPEDQEVFLSWVDLAITNGRAMLARKKAGKAFATVEL